MEISRRHFIQAGALGVSSLMFPTLPKALDFSTGGDPHFFIQVFLNGGVDQTYLFDARPLEMTAAGKLQNYLGQEPNQWSGRNGVDTHATALTNPFREFQNDITILNGVVMAHSFDGHIENTQYLYSGNPFGGASYLPHLNEATSKVPLDTIAHGLFVIPSGIVNISSTLTLTAAGARSLIKEIKTGAAIDTTNPWVKFAESRMTELGAGSGSFAAGNRGMLAGYSEAPRLVNAIKTIDVADPVAGTPETDQFLAVISEVFKKGVAQSAIVSYGDGLALDVHAAIDAKNIKTKLQSAVDRVVKLLRYLKNTPYDSTRSLFDCTTVLISSEFSRTMRQENMPIDQTGTDHNAINNSVYLAGKGIRGGLVIGASDYQASTETLSGAHTYMDFKRIKIMGAPFDFANMQTRMDKPQSFNIADYLTFNSVINTVYSLFNVPADHYRLLGRDMPVAPILRGILS